MIEHHIDVQSVGVDIAVAFSVERRQTVHADEWQRVAVGIHIGCRLHVTAVNDAGAGERRGVIDRAEELVAILLRDRSLLDVHTSTDIQRQRCRLRHIIVKIGAIVETLVLEVEVIIQSLLLEQTILSEGTQRDEVADFLRTATDIDVVLGLKGRAFEQIVHPVDIRITYRIGVILELLQYGIREPGSSTIVDLHLVAVERIIV